ncbi:MAG: hypothetical protein ACREQ8_04850 [Woeseiaceae bacterium]
MTPRLVTGSTDSLAPLRLHRGRHDSFHLRTEIRQLGADASGPHDVGRARRLSRVPPASPVVVVVSAIGRHTDSLLAEAHRLTAKPSPDHAVASLLATAEQQRAALLTIALDRAGIPCRLMEPSLLDLRLAGEPVSVSDLFLKFFLADTPVIVIPGFIGVSSSGELALIHCLYIRFVSSSIASIRAWQRDMRVKPKVAGSVRRPAKNEIIHIRAGAFIR